MKIKKKAIALLCTLCTAASLTTPVLATEATPKEGNPPRSTLTEEVSNHSFSGSAYLEELAVSFERKGGLFYCQGNAIFKGYQRAYMVITLEREGLHGWESVKTWYSDTTSYGPTLELRKSTQAVQGWYKYRCSVEVRVFDSTGQVIERQNKYSNVIEY